MQQYNLPFTLGMIINHYCSVFLKRSRGSIKVATFVSDFPFDELTLGEFEDVGELEVDSKKIHEEEGFVLWNYSVRYEVHGEVLAGNFLVLQVGRFIFVITGQPAYFLHKFIMRFAKQMYPELIIAYITADEIRQVLENFSRSKQVELFYTRYVAKRMFGRRFTGLGYGEDKFSEAFKKSRGDGLWIDSIRVFSSKERMFDFRIARTGLLVYRRGNFEEYYRHVLSQIIMYCSRRLKIFDKKGRSERRNKEPTPLIIRFDSSVFENENVRKELPTIVSKYDFCNYSVIHAGNPHVYINIVDRVDNSTFSLRTYGTDSLLLIPQIKATRAALMRFSKHLMDKFQEGKVSEFVM